MLNHFQKSDIDILSDVEVVKRVVGQRRALRWEQSRPRLRRVTEDYLIDLAAYLQDVGRLDLFHRGIALEQAEYEAVREGRRENRKGCDDGSSE